jgi:dTDP-4-dehydrorhamnose reductase
MTPAEASIHLALSNADDIHDAIENNLFQAKQELIQKADSSTFSQPAKRPARTGFILDKAKSVLGYSPSSFNEGIAFMAKQVK